MTYKTRILSFETRVHIFWTLVLVMVIAFGLYIYSVNTTMRNTALRQELEAKVAHLSAEVGALEFAYVEKRNEATLDLAYSYGFKEVRNPLYVSRTPGSALTLNTVR